MNLLLIFVNVLMLKAYQPFKRKCLMCKNFIPDDLYPEIGKCRLYYRRKYDGSWENEITFNAINNVNQCNNYTKFNKD